jgi:hypothetical protein
MILPKIIHPLFQVIVPSTKKPLQIRAMLSREEKILLTAKESTDQTDILHGIRQVVNNCVIDDKFEINDLTMFDLEYLFIKLRSISISNTTKVSYKDVEDEQIRDFDIDLDKVTILFPDPGAIDTPSDKVIVNENVWLKLKYPSSSIYDDKDFLNASGEEAIERLVMSVIDKVYGDGQEHETNTLSYNELKEYIDELPIKSYNEIRNWLFNLPHLDYKIKYTNNKGNEKTIVLSTLNDFFTLA